MRWQEARAAWGPDHRSLGLRVARVFPGGVVDRLRMRDLLYTVILYHAKLSDVAEAKVHRYVPNVLSLHCITWLDIFCETVRRSQNSSVADETATTEDIGRGEEARPGQTNLCI